MSGRVYLDWNATTPLRPEARTAMQAAMDIFGNPSSVHSEGRAGKAIVERARGQVAALCGCNANDVVFTSGATEGAGLLGQTDSRWIEDTAHDALWNFARENEIGAFDVIAQGVANSETGVIIDPPVRSEGAFNVENGAVRGKRLFLDATQAVGKLAWSFAWSGADFAALSAHKLGGPKGVGAVLIRGGVETAPLQAGGGQEMGRRSGTENVIGIAGFGAACKAAMRDLNSGVWSRVEKLRNILETALATSATETIFVGKSSNRLPNTSCIVTPGWKGETQVMQMDLAGFAISSGAACSSGKVRASRVLKAMGFDDMAAASAIRVSLGWATTEEDVQRFVEAWLEQEQKFRRKAA